MTPHRRGRPEAIVSEPSNRQSPRFVGGSAILRGMALRSRRKPTPEPAPPAEPVAAPAASPDAAPEPSADTSTPTPRTTTARPPAYDYDRGF